jgi:nicotinamide-nucleotide amidase
LIFNVSFKKTEQVSLGKVMKKASIVSTGSEILLGRILDTNAAYLSEKLFSTGIPVVSFHTVGDDIEQIIRALETASGEADVVLITGGLGPTDDDLTRQALAKFLGIELKMEEGILRKIIRFFIERNLRMPEKNKVQAYIPVGARSLANHIGTAPGIMTEKEGKLFAAMPGVPTEMKRMFEESVLPELEKFGDRQAIVLKKLRCFGMGESAIAEMLGSMMQRGRNPLVNCTVEAGVITLHIIATAESKEQAQQLADKDEKKLRKKLGELVYGEGEQSLAEVVGEKLAGRGETVAVAESCTGGELAKLITDIPGASRYFRQGWVTYSNESKVNELGVPAELIERYGAVSYEAAEAMAKQARKISGTDYAIAITGISGPTGATEQKPLGLVYISVDSGKGCETRRFVFPNNRELMRIRSAQAALNMLRLILQV